MRFKHHRRKGGSGVGKEVRKPTDERRTNNKPVTMDEFNKIATKSELRVTEHISSGGRTFINAVTPEGAPRTMEIKGSK